MKSTSVSPEQTSVDFYSFPFSGEDADDDAFTLINSNNFSPASKIQDSIFTKHFYAILTQDDIHQRIDAEICQISSLLCLPKHQASLLLCSFNWSVTKIHDSWFSDESGVRLKLGLLEKPAAVSASELTCGICFESFTCHMISYAACGHPFCNDCWSSYMSTSINNDGIQCLLLKCPQPSCSAAVGPDMINRLVYGDDWIKYSMCVVRSYVEGKKNIKWCPGPGCGYAVEVEWNGEFNVTCRCFTSFCWNCGEENHRPVDCETAKKWSAKNESESENVNYILAYCKPCPNCRRPIEKNAGCMHMVCKICSHSFCWLCLSPYKNHRQCNGFLKSEVKKKEMAKQSLEKYTHYFERWDANRKSKLKVLQDFRTKNVILKKLSEAQGIPEGDLEFITRAWLQVVECRRVLEWSYAYGYYMPENEHAKRQFFEYVQEEAENGLEKLHNCLDTNDIMSKDLVKFRTMLVGLTAVTGNYFEKLVRALENGLCDVISYANDGAGSSSSSKNSNEVDDCWFCDRCSFANPGSVFECKICVLDNEA